MFKKDWLLLIALFLVLLLTACESPEGGPTPTTVTIDYGGPTSYDFSERQQYANYSDGDFYLYNNDGSPDGFYANDNPGQNGLQDIGAAVPDLDAVDPPVAGYVVTKVDIVLDHAYVAMAEDGEVNCYIIFNVTAHDDDANTVTLEYLYKQVN